MKKGFSLSELMIVIGVVSLMACILFPVFAVDRTDSEQESCASNEKQLGVAVMHYMQDYDENFPIATSFKGNGPTGWAGRIHRYVNGRQYFACPGDSSAPSILEAKDKLSYAFNVNLRGTGSTEGQPGWPVGKNPAGGAVSKLAMPQKTILLVEVTGMGTADINNGVNLSDTSNDGGDDWSLFVNGGDNGGPGWIPTGQWQYNTGVLGSPGRPLTDGYYRGQGVHGGGSDFLFADGHVQWLSPQSVSSGGPALRSGCEQDQCASPGWMGNAASTDAADFSATFSPV